MSEGLLIDVVVIVLLGATIFFAFRLDRRLQSMRNVQSELAGVIRELNSAASRAEAGIQGLKNAAHSSGQQLEDKIKSAKDVGDELAILLRSTEKFGRVSDGGRPQNNQARATSGPVMPQAAPARTAPPQRPALDALRALSLAS